MATASAKARVIGIVDDDPAYREYVGLLLGREGYEVHEAADGPGLMALLRERQLDCIVLDYRLASETGFHVHERLKQMPSAPPVIMLTGAEDQQTAVRALRSGGDDFVAKRGLKSTELVSAIEHVVKRRYERDTQTDEPSVLRRYSAFDPATGLYARHEIEHRLRQMVESAQHRQGRFAIIACGIVGAQEIADRFGPVAGDRALKAAATRLKDAVRPDDSCGRVGTATFACLLASARDSERMARREAAIAEAVTFEISLDAARIALKGETKLVCYPEDGTDPVALLNDAIRPIEASLAAASALAAANRSAAAEEGGAEPAIPATTESGSERRQARRHRIYKSAKIMLGPSVIDCTVHDISEIGARLLVPSLFAVPREFDLWVKDGGTRRVKFKWQNETEIGVEFVR